MVLAVIIIFIIKKRKHKKNEKAESLMEVDWDKIQNTYAEDPNMYLPEDHFTYIPQVPDTISTSVANSSTPITSKNGLERPDTTDHHLADFTHRDKQKPDIMYVNRDQIHKPNF